METYHYPDKTGVPASGVLLPVKGVNEHHLFWCEDGPQMKGFKVGYEEGKAKTGEHVKQIL